MFGSYTRPGRGLSKEEIANESRRTVFFSVLGRKLRQFMGLNMLFFLCNLPLIYFIYMPIINLGASLDIFVRYFLAVGALMFIGVGGLGIIAPGVFYVLRNFSRQEHAWVVKDFFNAIKSNIKQSFPVMLLDGVLALLWYNAFMSYSQSEGIFSTVAMVVLAVAAYIYYAMHGYIYLIMIEYRLSLGKILKNAFLFVLINLPANILATVIMFLLSMLTFSNSAEFGLMVSFVISPVLLCYIYTFFIDETISRFMKHQIDTNQK